MENTDKKNNCGEPGGVENNSSLTPLAIYFDKWLVVRRLQVAIFALSIVAGAAHLLRINSLIQIIQIFPLRMNLPVVTDWIIRVSHTYSELDGLDKLLQLVWLLVLCMVIINLIVALPELKHKPFATSPLEDERKIVDRALHSKLYHHILCLHFDAQAFTDANKAEAKQQTARLHQIDKSLAKLIVSNLYKLPASGYLCLSIFLMFYFTGTEAGAMDLVRRFVYLGFPLIIFSAGMLITEITIYFCAAVLSNLSNS